MIDRGWHVGLELDDRRVVAVALDEGDAGPDRVRSRASAAVSGDLAAAARSVIRQVLQHDGVAESSPIGVASPTPEAQGVGAAIAALGREFPGLAATRPAVASGAAAALAESSMGAARGSAHVVFFSAGDRAMAGIVRGGATVTGARGRAASVSWLALNPVEREDYRKTGCLEAEVAASGIVRRLIWRIKAGDKSRAQDAVAGDLSAITIQHVFEAAHGGDGVAIAVVRDTVKYLGMAAANLVAIADPETIVLGGIMATEADLLLEPVRVEVGRRLPRAMMDALTIVPAALGDRAAAIGAALASAPLQ